MKIDMDFFQTTVKTLREKFQSALKTMEHTVAAHSKRLPLVTAKLSRFCARFREENFLQDTYAKFVTRGKNKSADLLFWLRENAFLKNSRVFFRDTYVRVVVRREYTKRDLIALFILAVILGAGMKSIATETITIGFQDYTLASEETLYDFDALQQKLIDEGGGSLTGSSAAPVGACSQ